MRIDEEALKARFSFQVGLRFELFYALQALTDPAARLHEAWKAQALAQLPPSFHTGFAAIGGAPGLWAMIADVLSDAPATIDFDALRARIAGLPPAEFQRQILVGALHDAAVAGALIDQRVTLAKAIGRLPPGKRDWLEHIGLYPIGARTPAWEALTALCASPAAFQRQVVALLTTFWQRVFQATWESLQTRFAQSLAEKERLFPQCTLAEFTRLSLLRIEVDEAHQLLEAIRGGYTLPLARLRAAVVMPSAFNTRRYWSAYEERDGDALVYLPYFDPAITPDATLPAPGAADPELDPALITKALGDATRLALLAILARKPSSSAELAELLSVSRPTISHHVYLLREAGLLDEQRHDGSIRLSVRRATVEALSGLLLRHLYGPERRSAR